MLKRLEERYNYTNKMPFQKKVLLPISQTMVKITVHDAKATIQKLLTDPRIKPDDYLFWEKGNPLAGPPENLEYISDFITGRAYLDTHARIIHQEGEQLLGVFIYTDGTPVSHFHNMELIHVEDGHLEVASQSTTL